MSKKMVGVSIALVVILAIFLLVVYVGGTRRVSSAGREVKTHSFDSSSWLWNC